MHPQLLLQLTYFLKEAAVVQSGEREVAVERRRDLFQSYAFLWMCREHSYKHLEEWKMVLVVTEQTHKLLKAREEATFKSMPLCMSLTISSQDLSQPEVIYIRSEGSFYWIQPDGKRWKAKTPWLSLKPETCWNPARFSIWPVKSIPQSCNWLCVDPL